MKTYLFKYNEPYPGDGDMFLPGCFDKIQNKNIKVFNSDGSEIGKALIDDDKKGVFVKDLKLDYDYKPNRKLGFGFFVDNSQGEKPERKINEIEIAEILPLNKPFIKKIK